MIGADPAGRAATAWLRTDQIKDLIVLRADRLSAGGWDWLLHVSRHTGARLLLVCHVHAVPPALGAVLENTEHQILTTLRQVLPGRARRKPAKHHAPDPASEPAAQACDLPAYAVEDVASYRRLAPSTIGLRGFLRTDAVFQQGQAAALTRLGHRLPNQQADDVRVLDIAKVQLFLTQFVQDSPSGNHTLARLRGRRPDSGSTAST